MRHFFISGRRTEKHFVHSTSLPREKQARATLKRSGAMLVPGKRCESNKKSAILLVREQLHLSSVSKDFPEEKSFSYSNQPCSI